MDFSSEYGAHILGAWATTGHKYGGYKYMRAHILGAWATTGHKYGGHNYVGAHILGAWATTGYGIFISMVFSPSSALIVAVLW